MTPFRDFALVAAAHHEKLDGSGYPWGLRGPDLEPAARILAVADISEALAAYVASGGTAEASAG